MDELILTMIVALEKFGDKLGFTKQDIDNFVKKYNLLIIKPKCNERGLIILLKEGYITNEQFAEFMDVHYEDNSYWLIINSFSDILSKKDYEIEVSFLDGNYEWEPNYYDTSFYDIKNYYWKKYNEETLKSIINVCDKEGFEIDDDITTTENTILKNGDIYFNDQKLVDIIDDNEDEFSELIRLLSNAISEAQDSAQQSKIYQTIKKNFENKVGTFKYEKIKGEYKLCIQLDFDMDEVENFLKKEYREYEFDNETYGNLVSILSEMNFFDFKKVNLDYIYASIKDEDLNEKTQSRLKWG